MADGADPELAVLVVEDDQEMRALLRRILEATGYRVLERGGADGLPEALRDVRVDVVVLDKEMPGTGGLQALAQLRRSHPRLPVILITAFGGPDVERRALALGATRYLEKPFPLRHLIESVRQASRVSALPLGGPDTG